MLNKGKNTLKMEIVELYEQIGTIHIAMRQLEPITEHRLGRPPTGSDWRRLMAEFRRREGPVGLEVRHDR